MNRLIAILALSTGLGLAACDDPNPGNAEFGEAPMEAPMAPPAEDVAAPVVETRAVDTPPTDTTSLPPERRSSEESVKPESETLFY